MQIRTIQPSAAILVESMRDIGYTLDAAIADLIDNSIAAGAHNIDILGEPVGESFAIGILDDGVGMSRDELFEAMRLGSKNPRDKRARKDLGRFGLGLKTASFSQCRRLSVVTRKNGQTTTAIWDLDEVAVRDSWDVLVPESEETTLWSGLIGDAGTLVVWEKLDRVLDVSSSNPSGLFASKLSGCSDHLQLTFHRFLSGEFDKKKLSIAVNGRQLRPRDPFHTGHPATQKEPQQPEPIRVAGQDVFVQTFTLPHHKKVTENQWREFGGDEGYVRNQGFYMYREGRLIMHGTWFGLARQTELTKLARVRIDIPNTLDAEWKIDVRKASAQPPAALREHLKRLVERIGATSKRAYTTRGTVRISDERFPVWNRVQDKSEITYRLNDRHPMLQTFVESLDHEQTLQFARLNELIAGSMPFEAIFADMGGNPEMVQAASVSADTLLHDLRLMIGILPKAQLNRDGVTTFLRLTEPFRSNWSATEPLIDGALAEAGV